MGAHKSRATDLTPECRSTRIVYTSISVFISRRHFQLYTCLLRVLIYDVFRCRPLIAVRVRLLRVAAEPATSLLSPVGWYLVFRSPMRLHSHFSWSLRANWQVWIFGPALSPHLSTSRILTCCSTSQGRWWPRKSFDTFRREKGNQMAAIITIITEHCQRRVMQWPMLTLKLHNEYHRAVRMWCAHNN